VFLNLHSVPKKNNTSTPHNNDNKDDVTVRLTYIDIIFFKCFYQIQTKFLNPLPIKNKKIKKPHRDTRRDASYFKRS